MADLASGTVTFLFSDVEGSTRILEEHPRLAGRALARHHELFEHIVQDRGGRIFETVGDAVYAAFARATDAVLAAADVQEALAQEDWGPIGALRCRIAVHTGEVEGRGDHYFGPALFRSARLQALGHGGQTLLSGVTARLVEGGLPREISLRDHGLHRLKDLAQPEHVHELLHPGSDGEYPPLRSLDRHPHNLPLQLSSFVGREAELTRVSELLRSHRLVTLTGPGGIGKTRLALQAAADLIDDFVDGVFFVDLAPIHDPELVPSAIAEALRLNGNPERSPEDALADALRSRQLLLVLDNFEQVLAAAPIVAGLLSAAAGVRVLATSRAQLYVGGERVVPVDPLPIDETGGAIQLFVERAAERGAPASHDPADRRAITEICRRLDGLPLALELAASRAAVIPPTLLLKRLSATLSALPAGRRDAPDRQQTLRSTIDWSWQLLDPPQQRMFARLAVFSGGFRLDAAEVVCDDERGVDVLGVIEELVRHSLVQPAAAAGGQPRFRLLETIRQFAQEQLEAGGEAEAARHRHEQFVVQLVEAGEPGLLGRDGDRWLAELIAEGDNIRSAFAYANDHNDAEILVRLSGALWHYWSIRGGMTEARKWCERALQLGPDMAPIRRARVLHTAGCLAFRQRDLSAADAMLSEAATIFRSIDEDAAVALCLDWLGCSAIEAGEYDRGAALFAEGLQLAEQAGDDVVASWIRSNRVHLRLAADDLEGAREEFVRGKPALDIQSVAIQDDTLAEIDWLLGHLDSAEELATRGLRRFQEFGDPEGVVSCSRTLAWIALERGDTAASRVLLARARREVTAAQTSFVAGLWLEPAIVAISRSGEQELAARLWGSLVHWRDRAGVRQTPALRRQVAQHIGVVRDAVGAERFDTLMQAGRGIDVDRAVSLAAEALGVESDA